jgi:hypothetical protein
MRPSVHVILVDGSDYPPEPRGHEFIASLLELEAQGANEKEVIHALLGDDWGAPPKVVIICWTDDTGGAHERRLGYD